MAPNYTKLKTNLRLAINRLKLLEKKKTELALKARREIADYISAGKDERARIRVEHIIREDYMVEGMEILEMYCDLILARMGLIQQMKNVDEGLQEAITSVLWAAPRLQADVAELRIISEQFTAKYGKPFTQASHEDSLNSVNEKLKHKLGVQAPPKILVEKYMIEIAKSHNIPFEPDPSILREDEVYAAEAMLIDLGGAGGPGGQIPPPPHGKGSGGGGGGGGGMALPEIPSVPGPPMPQPQQQPFNYPATNPNYPPPQAGVPGGMPVVGGYPPQGPPQGPPPQQQQAGPLPSKASGGGGGGGIVNPNMVQPGAPPLDPANYSYHEPPSYNTATTPQQDDALGLPELPQVPAGSLPRSNPNQNVGGSSSGGQDLDFDDLTRRFEELKKRK